MLNPGRLTATSGTQKATISAVDQNLLQPDHLNTWRDLRSIDEVVRHNRVTNVYLPRVQEWGPKLLKNNPDQTKITQIEASEWAKSKPHRALAIVMYYLIEIMKSHSPKSQHKDIERLARGIEDSSQFQYYYNSVIGREMVNTFMHDHIRKFSWYLLVEQYSKGFKADHKGVSKSLIKKAISDWKGKITEAVQAEYTRHYRRYMSVIESLDVLAAIGVQDRNVIRTVDSSRISLRDARAFFSKHSSDPHTVHKNLVSIARSDKFRALQFPLFGYPLDIDGKKSAEIEATVLDLWKSHSQNDVNFASELIEISRSLPGGPFLSGEEVCPKRVRETRGYRILIARSKKNNSPYSQMWSHVGRTINLAAKIDKHDSEEQSILWQIIRATFLSLSKDPEIDKCERHIENSVMFYLFIRRVGGVLEEAVQRHFPTAPPGTRVRRSQFMFYYWSLMSHKNRGENHKLEKTVKWMEFDVGRAYLNHLIASKELNEFYNQIKLHREDRPRELVVLDEEEGPLLHRSRMVKEAERRLQGGHKDSYTDRTSLARGTNNEPGTLQHASNLKSSPYGQKFISDYNQHQITKLNFERFWGTSNRSPHVLTSNRGLVTNNALTHISFQPFADKRKSDIASLGGSETEVTASFKKKPRIQAAVSSSSEGAGSHYPAQDAGPTSSTLFTDGTKSTFYRNYPIFKEPPTSQESRTGGLPSSIRPVSGETSERSGQPTPPLNLKVPSEDAPGKDESGIRLMLPDLNEPLTPVSSQEDLQRASASDPRIHPSFWQHSGSVGPVIPARDDSSQQAISRKEIPDLNK